MMQDRVMEGLQEEIGSEGTANGASADAVSANAASAEDASPETTAPATDAAAAQVEQLQAELAAAQAKADELTDKLQRTAAEFQNSRRRQERQLAEEIERASSHLLRRLLPALDDLNLAFQNVPAGLSESESAWLNGFRQIQKKLQNLLEEEGVTQVPLDGAFDPTRHEAISSEPHDSVPSGHIIETLRAGYEYKGRVLRPALVRVAG
jgi:molecular chaperone GrpE